MNNIIYPSVSGLITLSDVPGNTEILETIIDDVFKNLYYRNFRNFKSNDNVSSSSSLEIITARPIKLDVPGAEIAIVLNPSYAGQFSLFPLRVSFFWGIKKYIRSFNLSNFSETASAFYDIIQEIIDPSEEDILSASLGTLINNNDPLNYLASKINTNYGTAIQVPVNTNTTVAYNDILTAVHQANLHLRDIVFTEFIIAPNLNQTFANINLLFTPLTGKQDIVSFLKDLFIPQITAQFQLGLGIEISRKYLRPAKEINGEIVVESDETIKTIIEVAEADIFFDSKGGLRIQQNVSASFMAPYTLAQIGSTPLFFGFQNLKLDLSRKNNIPEADADGRPADFVGVYIQEATIIFPQFWNHDGATAQIKGRNLIIGTGGISGFIALEGGPNSSALFKFGDHLNTGKHFALSIWEFNMEFKQNSIVQSNISGTMQIPGFKNDAGNDAHINITVHIGNNGDLKVTACEPQGVSINILDAVKLVIRDVAIGRENDRWYIEASGQLYIIANIPGVGKELKKTPIDIKKLRIWQDGTIEFVGGNINLPLHKNIGFGPVSLMVENISFGSHESLYAGQMRQYYYFGFNGSLKTAFGSVGTRGDGIEFHFTRDNLPFHSYLKLSGIDIDIKIPGEASAKDADVYIQGFLSMRTGEPAGLTAPTGSTTPPVAQSGPEYEGGVSFRLRSLGISGKGNMSMRPQVPAWIVDIELDLNTPITLGGTGLGIYGFRGMIGQHYVASKTYVGLNEDDSWYSYLKKPQRGVNFDKFDPNKASFTVGVGATIATMGDDGWAFSTKVFVMLSMPELLLIEGQANVLHKRLGIDDANDPPFYAYLVVDDNSIQAGLGVNYQVANGKILDLNGEMQVAYFFNSPIKRCFKYRSCSTII